MTIFILVSILLVAALAIALLMGVSPLSFSNIGKKRSDIASFLCQVFKAYFPAGENSVSKKILGLDKVKERREKENKSR